MFTVSLQKGRVSINDFFITDLQRPFKRLLHDTAGIEQRLRTPSETLKRWKPYPFYVKLNKVTAGSLYTTQEGGFPAQWIYPTNAHISALFVDKALTTLLSHLAEVSTDVYDAIREYLRTVIFLILQTYPFDCIFTPLKFIMTLASPAMTFPEVIYDETRLVSLPLKTTRKRHRAIQAILSAHGNFPLALFDASVYNVITFYHTNFDQQRLVGRERVLILVGTNLQYAGFLAKKFQEICKIREVLPVALFKVSQ